MALPTAQLGQMSNINVPSYVPTTIVPKKQSGLETALMAFLMNAAGAAGGQAVSNVMAKDTAAPGEKAGFFSKLVGGPTQTVAENQAALARAQQEKLATSQEQAAMGRLLEGERGANLRASLSLREQANQGSANRDQQTALENARIARDREQQAAQIQARINEVQQQFQGQSGLEELRNRLTGPSTQAEIELRNAERGRVGAQTDDIRSQTAERNIMAQRMSAMLGGGQGAAPNTPGAGTPSTGATEAVRQAARQAVQTQGASSPQGNQVSYEDFQAQNPNSMSVQGQTNYENSPGLAMLEDWLNKQNPEVQRAIFQQTLQSLGVNSSPKPSATRTY